MELGVAGRRLISSIAAKRVQSTSLRIRRTSACSLSGLVMSGAHHHDKRTTSVLIPVGPPY